MKYVGRRRADSQAGSKQKKSLPIWQETLLLLGTALILALVIKTFFVQAFYIPSGSMRETLQVNDRILVQKVSYWFGDVERGDIVVFDDRAGWLGQEGVETSENLVVRGLAKIGLYPTGGHLVKRVIGVGGDTVECADGKVVVNGVALDEDSYVTLAKQACTGAWVVDVPEGRIWVMGDNRNHSADSRVHLNEVNKGTIPVDDVVGKVFVVVWPISRWDVIGRPDTFDSVNDASGLATTLVPAGLALMVGYPLYRRRRKESRADDR
jgi:signal peptidase I